VTDPRWLDPTSELDELERSVLASGLGDEPPPGADRVIWRDLVGALPLTAAATGIAQGVSTSGSAAAKGALSLKGVAGIAVFAKGFALGVGVSLAVAGAARLLSPSQERAPSSSGRQHPVATATPNATTVPTLVPTPELPTVASAPIQAPVQSAHISIAPASTASSTVVLTPTSTPSVGARPTAHTTSVGAFAIPDSASSAKPAARSRLEEEAELIRQARAELQKGALAQAHATLEAARTRFAAPELTQEREALAVELVYREGDHARAASLARRFLALHPESPHAARMRDFLAP